MEINLKKYPFFLLFVIPTLLTAQVTVRDTTIVWHTFNYTLNQDNTVNFYTNQQYDTVPRILTGKILENKFLKVTLLPEFGGRILSMVYKPTGHEELYQNPCGAPYGIGQNWFYYKWLMVYGGIFPTLPEPEHGKAWCVPWKFDILTETPDTVSCRMSWKDTVQLQGIDVTKWQYGKTNLRCDFTLTLIDGASSLEADVALYNDSTASLNYEYWTCLTLAPGSEPGNPQCTQGAEIIVPTSKIKITGYPDIESQEKPIQGEPNIYTFDKLRYWKNWPNDGIAYAWDDPHENYWGLINHDDEEGIIRVADNNITPGIKMWAWGYPLSQNIDPYKDPGQDHRPYVELWAGHSNEFFTPAQFAKNSEKKWKEIYAPTVGLSNVTHANDEIIADIKIDTLQTSKVVDVSFTTTRPNNHFNVSIGITGQNPQVLTTQSIVPDPVHGNRVMTNLPDNQIWSSGDSVKYTITDSANGSSLAAALSLNTVTTGISGSIRAVAKDYHLSQNYPNPFNPETMILYTLAKSGFASIKVYDVLGREVAVLVDEYKAADTYKLTFNASALGLPSGVYFYTLVTSGYTQTRKMILVK